MRKLLLFFALCCVSIGAWAYSFTGDGIKLSDDGSDTQKIELTSAGKLKAWYDGLTDAQKASWNGSTRTKLVITGPMNADDISVFSDDMWARFEAVSLPDGLKKEQVNAVGAALSGLTNTNFSACVSQGSEMEDVEVTRYWYDDPCSSMTDPIEYTGTVNDGKGNVENIARTLTLTGSSSTYVNTKFRNEASTCSENQVQNGYVVPNPLKVELTKTDNPTYTYSITWTDGNTYSLNSWDVDENGNLKNGYWTGSESIPAGTPVDIETIHNYSYTYTWRENWQDQTKTYDGEPQGNETDGFYAMITNVYSGNDQQTENGYRFEVTSAYNYTYTDLECNEQTVSYSEPHSTIDLAYNQEVTLTETTETVQRPVEGSAVVVTAYVNKAGELYKATQLAGVNPSNVSDAILSGNLNGADLSKQYGVTNAFSNSTTLTHYDLSDATLANTDDLVCAGNDGNNETGKKLKQIELPKNLTAIPDNCFASCNQLSKISIPGTVTNIGENAFQMCFKLSDVDFVKGSDPLTFGAGAFERCESLDHISLPERTTAISDRMFNQCYVMQAVRIPNTATSIGANAFYETLALTDITIPTSIREIGAGAFDHAALTDIYLMAEDPCELPKIYSSWSKQDSPDQHDPSFGEKFTDAYGSTPTLDQFKAALNTSIDRGLVTDLTSADVETMNYLQIAERLTSDQMAVIYAEIGAGKSLVTLHYQNNDAMNDFLNYNKNKELTKEELKNRYLGTGWAGWLREKTGVASNEIAAENEAQRVLDCEVLQDTYVLVDAWGRRWPELDHNDLGTRREFGRPKNNQHTDAAGTCATGIDQEPSIIAWREFLLQDSYTPNEDEVHVLNWDDTWHSICFPFDLTDEQLGSALNPRFNIVEFSGATIDETEPGVKNLVLLFTNIGQTYYKDQYGNYYKRTKNADGTRHYKHAKRQQKNSGEWYLVETDENIPGSNASEFNQGQEGFTDIIVDGYLAFAGHPYLIHPDHISDEFGNATECIIHHVQYVENWNKLPEDSPEKAAALQTIMGLYESEQVTHSVTKYSHRIGLDDPNPEGDIDYLNMKNGKIILEPDPDVEGAQYTFKGTFDIGTIPYRSYFLGKKSGQKYPKFYREVSKNAEGKWTKYTAVVEPNAKAQKWEDANLSNGSSSTSSGAKQVMMGFGDFDFEEVEATEIEKIVAEAEKNDQPVVKYNVIVNINGQVVREGLDMTGLPKGIYIVNGKKYLVK